MLRGQGAIECGVFAPRACDVAEIALPVSFPGNSSPPCESFNRYLIQAFSAFAGDPAERFIQTAWYLANSILHASIVGVAGTQCKLDFHWGYTRRLLEHFGSLQAVKQADPAALSAVVTRVQAEAISNHFRKSPSHF